MALKLNKAKFLELETKQIQTKKHTILIVDDEISNLQSIVRLLEKDYHIVTAQNGQEAYDLIKSDADPERFHLIISDQRMPKMTGVELFKNTLLIIPKTIRILLTGFTDVHAIIDSVNEGQIYRYLNKPIEPSDLEVTIRRALEAFSLEMRNLELVQELREINQSLEQRVAERTMQLMQQKEELQETNQLMLHLQTQMLMELEHARLTQLAMMPNPLPQFPDLRLASKYVPMAQIGGDFYDVFLHKYNKISIAIGDVTGHGIPAALISFMACGFLKTFAPKYEAPSLTLQLTNDALFEKIPENKFITIFYCTMDPQGGFLTYSSAGHPRGYIVRKNIQELIALDERSTVLGMFPSSAINFHNTQIPIQPGDKVVLYTDGILEVKDSRGINFGYANVEKCLRENFHSSIQAVLDAIYAAALTYATNNVMQDDITLVGIEVV